jgi:hypothetical protein
MPYIKPDDKAYPPSHASNMWVTDKDSAPGELNWKIAVLVDGYLRTYGVDYQRLNDVVGALECNKLEIYRRLAAPYEDQKIRDNGDVFSKSVLLKSNGFVEV